VRPQAALSLSEEGDEYEGRDDHLSNLGVVHMALGGAAHAARFFQKAKDSAQARGLDAWRRACHAGRLGMALAASGAHEQAFESLDEALELTGAHASQEAAPMASLARETKSEGRTEEALHLLEQTFLLLRSSAASN
jgi:tetratricopeptide (TPR) repeat protein